ncbi:MAG: carboxylesterase/lipase family protein [Proteobacteria bacterium]|nr:carboxylesterase/lipase family protein [Pseudomonadota bacterium]
MKNTPLGRRDFLRYASAAGLILPSSFALGQDATVDADTRFGRVRGRRLNGVNVFKGIPYGASTAGENRFMPPQDPAPWREYREAFEYGPAAPQSNPQSGRQQDGKESEDCLMLNVWTRGINDGGKRPVMFWCHGGGFRSLSGSSPLYDGTNLALRGDVVTVTLNHRLNVLGFTHLGDVDSDFASSGTVGMQDIVQALKWVRDNIENFGGDPNRVMIFGESGGGRKVATLLAMPEAKGLFHAAVIESGATLRLPMKEQAHALGERLLQELDISPGNVRRIQQVPLATLMSAYFAVSTTAAEAGGGAFAPTMEEEIIPFHPFWPDASPVNPDVPLIVGANRTEMTYFAADADFAMDEATMRNRIAGIVGEENVESVVDVYREANPDARPSEIYFLVFSDQRYVMPSIRIAERRSALNAAPVYIYYLAWRSPANGARIMSPHTLDIPLIFDNVSRSRLTAGSSLAQMLADRVSDTIINFARTGDPNVGKLPQWAPYDERSRATMVLNDRSEVVNDPLASRREIMQAILQI